MSRLRVYLEGKPSWTPNDPGRARIAGFGGLPISQALTIVTVQRPKSWIST